MYLNNYYNYINYGALGATGTSAYKTTNCIARSDGYVQEARSNPTTAGALMFPNIATYGKIVQTVKITLFLLILQLLGQFRQLGLGCIVQICA